MNSYIAKILLLLKTSEAVEQSILLTVGTVVTGLILALAMIIASRFLGPELFGVFSVSVSIMVILSKGVDLGLSQIIPRLMNNWHNNPKKVEEFLGQVLVWKIKLSIIIVLVGVLLIPFIENLLGYPYPFLILIAIIGSIGIAMYEHVYLVLSGLHRFASVNTISITQAIIKALGFLAVFLLGMRSAESISVIYYLAPPLTVLFFVYRWRKVLPIKPMKASTDTIKVVKHFIWDSLIGVTAMTLIANLDLLLVQHQLSLYDTGIYAGASRIAMFIGFVSASVGGVLSNRVSRYHDRADLVSYLRKSFLVVIVAVVGFALYLPLSRISLTLTAGPEYLPGLSALIILVLNAFISLAIVPFTAFFYSVNHPRYFSVSGIIQVSIIVIGNLLFLQEFGIVAAAWSRALATIAFGIFTAFYVVYALKKTKQHHG